MKKQLLKNHEIRYIKLKDLLLWSEMKKQQPLNVLPESPVAIELLENKFIKVLKIRGTPVRFEFRTSDNPFDGKKNQLSQRQISKKQRLVKHVNKGKKKDKRK